jgi:hypothetical protein
LSKYVSGNEDLADSQGESVEGQTFMGLNKWNMLRVPSTTLQTTIGTWMVKGKTED